ncbi:hypothetical protein F5Y04DRAFT_261289 [Hypomontagnella monticulosa]|nr:hypothetical protein F5Y04DRAFT_261289 [Hypomontagnella monticulosa]
MIPQRITIVARLRLVANRLPPHPTAPNSNTLRVLPIGAYTWPLVSFCNRIHSIPFLLLSRHNPVRNFCATMSATAGASSAASPADSPAEPSAPATTNASESTATTAATQPPSSDSVPEEKKLPPLKGAEFRAYNRLAEHMDLFHGHFRTAWNALWAAACAGNSSKTKASSRGGRGIINDGLAFVAQLEVHHSIEETYIFPILAQRMPEFRTDDPADTKGGKKGKGKGPAAELLRQHAEIHEGMDGMQAYLRACRDGTKELDMGALKAQMETWGTVLWTHLDQEVKTLGAENMRKYWTAEEIRRIPM